MSEGRACVAAALAGLALAAAPAVRAEKADQDKPTQIEANSMQSDQTRRLNIFEGNVVVTKGTLTVRADRLVVRQDEEGNQYTTATGLPVRFRQRQDPKEPGQEGPWMDGEAKRLEIDGKKNTIDLFDDARVTRDGDEVKGDHIFVDQTSDYFSASSGKGEPGRVKAVLQPKTDAGKAK